MDLIELSLVYQTGLGSHLRLRWCAAEGMMAGPRA